MNTIIVYATYSGSTEAAATVVKQVLESHGHSATLKEALELKPDDFAAADLVILASPSWDYHGEEGMPHENFLQAMQAFSDASFPNKKFAIVALGDSNFTHFCGSGTHLEAWVSKMQGALATETLKLDQYYFNEAENSARVKQWAENLSAALA